jgi:hypothetical protein
VADTKISALTAATSVNSTDEVAINQSGTSKRLTFATIEAFLEGLGLPNVARLGSQHSVSSATGTEVTGLQRTLVAGTYMFQYNLICRSSATGTGLGFSLNFTGTVTKMVAHMRTVTTGTTAATGVAEGSIATLTGNIMEGSAANAEATSTANLGPFTGVASTSEDILVVIDGIAVVSDGGDFELWHASEGAVATTVEVGSSCSFIRTA